MGYNQSYDDHDVSAVNHAGHLTVPRPRRRSSNTDTSRMGSLGAADQHQLLREDAGLQAPAPHTSLVRASSLGPVTTRIHAAGICCKCWAAVSAGAAPTCLFARPAFLTAAVVQAPPLPVPRQAASSLHVSISCCLPAPSSE